MSRNSNVRLTILNANLPIMFFGFFCFLFLVFFEENIIFQPITFKNLRKFLHHPFSLNHKGVHGEVVKKILNNDLIVASGRIF